MNTDREMKEIVTLYSFMSEDDKENWSFDEAVAMYEDEIFYCKEHSIENPLIGGAEVLYDTIKYLIQEDREDKEMDHSSDYR